MKGLAHVMAMVLASAATSTLAASPAAFEPPVAHGRALAERKGDARDDRPLDDPALEDRLLDDRPLDDPPLLATLDQVHTGERMVLDARTPSQAAFEALLSDRSTGEQHPLDAQLLGLLRQLAAAHPGARIELVSGYRSWKLNEMLRKKGHHVASHSQHSLGHACDFRIVPPGAGSALDPRVVEQEIRKLGWVGGVGVYPTTADWFVHADVGRNRRWVN